MQKISPGIICGQLFCILELLQTKEGVGIEKIKVEGKFEE